ncbi:HU family DNA-binding protein [Bacteroides sp. 51]|uniref:HU family DNA-binding protein n=1 Tax=Bacteroides sp. 51 TaxID=2302938 RepID=UPI0013D87CF1|nr:HU family DNA-binding protein [Bacteroides sp. 51]NDV81842.1 DNA-binding protein [Bacteroides sp. 51]
MAVPYKKILRKNPQDKTDTGKYYPQLITQGNSVGLDYIADIMQRFSSLSQGDIKSVLDNFVEAMRIALASGVSVNITDFGVFRLAVKAEGREAKKDCSAKCIKSVNISFRPSTSVKPVLAGTRGATKLQFFDIEKGGNGELEEIGEPTDPGAGGDDGEVIDPGF